MSRPIRIPENRIREWRERRELSMAALAERMGTAPGTVQKLEAGDMQLTVRWMATLADALDVDLIDLLVLPEPRATAARLPAPRPTADAIDWRPAEGDAVPTVPGVEVPGFVQMTSEALDELDIRPGDILIFDAGARACAAIHTGDVVVARQYSDDALDRYVQVVRQFVEPALLTTNSRRANAAPINTRATETPIKGVVKSLFRPRLRTSPQA